MLECVVNVSEGRRAEVVARLADACGAGLLDVHTDPDHHRSVFTIAADDPLVTQLSARRLVGAAATELTLTGHDGVHPRLGVVDVVPFVALAPTPPTAAIDAASRMARWLGDELAIPAFLYDLADPEHRTLPSVRRDAFTTRAPDAGPARPHPRLGATAVGARPVLVAVNVELEGDDVALARAVARVVRERGGGLAGVRALGLALASRSAAQVSMNLVDPETTGLEAACEAVRREIEARGGRVARVELVGLVPAAVLDATSATFRDWSGIGPDETIEARLAASRTGGPGAWAERRGGSTPGAGPTSSA